MALGDLIKQGAANDVRPKAANTEAGNLAQATLGNAEAPPQRVGLGQQFANNPAAQTGAAQLVTSLLSGHGAGRSLGQAGEALGRLEVKEQEEEDRITEAEQQDFENNLDTRKVDLTEKDIQVRLQIAQAASRSRTRANDIAERRLNLADRTESRLAKTSATELELKGDAGARAESTLKVNQGRAAREEAAANENSEANLRKFYEENVPLIPSADPTLEPIPAWSAGQIAAIAAMEAEWIAAGNTKGELAQIAAKDWGQAVGTFNRFKADSSGVTTEAPITTPAPVDAETPITTPAPVDEEPLTRKERRDLKSGSTSPRSSISRAPANTATRNAQGDRVLTYTAPEDISVVIDGSSPDASFKSLAVTEKAKPTNGELVDLVKDNPEEMNKILSIPVRQYPRRLHQIYRRLLMARIKAEKDG